MKEGRDFVLVYHINQHYSDLKEDIDGIISPKEFSESKERRRAILFDFLQIGELMHQLSKLFLERFDNNDATKIIAIRNRIVHGYSSIRDDIVFNTLKNNLPRFIEELNLFTKRFHGEYLVSLSNKKVTVRLDRVLLSNSDSINLLSYGYIDGVLSFDGEYQKAFVLSAGGSDDSLEGIVIGVAHYEKNIPDDLIVSTTGTPSNRQTAEKVIFAYDASFEGQIIMLQK